MRTLGAGPRGKLWTAIAAIAVGLVIAANGANATPPAGKGKPPVAANLARLLEEISLAAPADRGGAADAFVTAALGAGMDAVIDAALPALDDYRDEQRYYALVGLGAAGLASMENGEELSEIAFVLVSGLADGEATVRAAAAATLAAIQPAPPEWAADPLIELLGDPNPRVASAAMRALERMPANDAGFNAAYSAFDGDNSANRSRAARLLGAYGAQGADIKPAWVLAAGLGDPDAAVRWQTATALGDMGGAAIVAVRGLRAVSRDKAEDPMVRRAAKTALNSILD